MSYKKKKNQVAIEIMGCILLIYDILFCFNVFNILIISINEIIHLTSFSK